MARTPDAPETPADTNLEALRAALWQARVTQVLLSALLVVLAGTFLYVVAAPPSVPVDEAAVLAEAKERLRANSEAILEEATGFVVEAGRPVAKSFARQARQDLPVYARALQAQTDDLAAGLEEEVRRRVRAQTDDFVTAHRAVFREVFPEISDEETISRILRDYKRTADRLLERYYLDEFRREAKRTGKLWATFEPVEPPREGTLQDQLLEYVGDWLALQAKDRVTEAVRPSGR